MERSSVKYTDIIYKYSSYRGYCIIPDAIKVLSLISYTRSYLNFFWPVHSWEEAKVPAKAGTGKAVLLQAWSGPEGSRKLSFPDFMTTAQDGDKVVSLTHRPPLPPGNAPGTHFW